MKLNIIKAKEKGNIVYRIRDNKGKNILYLGPAEKVLKYFKLGKEYEQMSAQMDSLED